MESAANDLKPTDAARPGYLYELPRSFAKYWYGVKEDDKFQGLARMGVLGDGSCAYHSICAALHLENYNSVTEKQQKEIAYKFRCSFRDGLTQDKLKRILSKNKGKSSPSTLSQVETALCDPKIWADETAIRIVGEEIGINMIFIDTMKNKAYCGVHHDNAFTMKVPTMVILWINHVHFEPLVVINKMHEHTVEVKILLDPKNDKDLKLIRSLMDRYSKQCN
jgi:hypothetical protein